MIVAVRGRKGGFLLNKPASEITASAIVNILEGPCDLVDCVSKPTTCDRSESCASRDIWSLLGSKIDEVLSGFTLEQLVVMQESKSHKENAMYYI